MKTLLSHRGRDIAALLCAMLTACSSEPTGTSAAAVDAARTTADVAALRTALDQPAWRSFAALSGRFGLGVTGTAAVAGSADLIAAASLATRAPGGDAGLLVTSVTRVIADRASAAESNGAAISPTSLGTTFVYDPAQHRYTPDAARSGAPADGVRFILYDVDPQSGEPLVTAEIGHADLIDESATRPSGIGLHLRVVAGGVSLFDYRVTADGSADRGTLGVHGVVSDGATRITIDVAAAARATTSGSEGDVRFHIAIPERDFTVVAATHGVVSGTHHAGAVDLTIHSGGTTVGVSLAARDHIVDGRFTVNGRLFATVHGSAENPAVRGAGGHELTPDERTMLGAIMHLGGVVGEMFAALLGPVALMFVLAGMTR